MRALTPLLLTIAATIPSLAEAQAQPQAQSAAPVRARWISRWDVGECQLIRGIGEPPAPALQIRSTPGTNSIGLFFPVPAGSRLSRGNRTPTAVVFSPSGQRVEGQTAVVFLEGRTLYEAVAVPEGPFLTALAGANSLRVEVDGRPMADVRLGNVGPAVDVLRQCMNDQLREWHIDPAAFASLSRRPVAADPGGAAAYFSNSDYPSEALRAHQSGTSIVRLDINPQGRVAACTVLSSSTVAVLDQRTCLILTQRGRFVPALDAAGAPTTAPTVAKVRWTLPSR